MTALVWPMSFPAWTACNVCGTNHVEWVDASPEVVEGRLVGVVCPSCTKAKADG